MAVTVTTPPYNAGDPKKTKHAEADGFNVEDGHLIVQRREEGKRFSTKIAVYAPTRWMNAVVED